MQRFSLTNNKWKLHSRLPKAVFDPSAVVLNDVIYNIGGYHSSHSAVWCSLSSNYSFKWQDMNLANNYSFKGYWIREAFVVEDRIVYFGSQSREATFVLKKEQDSE